MDRFLESGPRLAGVVIVLAALGCAPRGAPPSLPSPFDDQVCREASFRVPLPFVDEVVDEDGARDETRRIREEWGATGEDGFQADLGIRWDSEGTPSAHPFRSNLEAGRAWELAERLTPHLRRQQSETDGARWVEAHQESDGTVAVRLHIRLTGIPPIRTMANERCLPHRHHLVPLHQARIELSREPRPGVTTSPTPVFRLALDETGEVTGLELVAGPPDDLYRRLAREVMEAMRWDPALVNGEPQPDVTFWRVPIPLSVREAAALDDVSSPDPTPPPHSP